VASRTIDNAGMWPIGQWTTEGISGPVNEMERQSSLIHNVTDSAAGGREVIGQWSAGTAGFLGIRALRHQGSMAVQGTLALGQ
jgi:hypothetical protein